MREKREIWATDEEYRQIRMILNKCLVCNGTRLVGDFATPCPRCNKDNQISECFSIKNTKEGAHTC